MFAASLPPSLLVVTSNTEDVISFPQICQKSPIVGLFVRLPCHLSLFVPSWLLFVSWSFFTLCHVMPHLCQIYATPEKRVNKVKSIIKTIIYIYYYYLFLYLCHLCHRGLCFLSCLCLYFYKYTGGGVAFVA